jgi:hypothetical protein
LPKKGEVTLTESLYSEELNFLANIPEDRFPSFLNTVLFNDFGERYYEMGIGGDSEEPVFDAMKRLRRRYNNYFDWVDAMAVWNEYMDIMAAKYGSRRVARKSWALGLIPDIVPAKPKLKGSKKNKEFLSVGFVPSHRVFEPMDFDALKDLAEELYAIGEDDEIDERDVWKKAPKKYRKMLEEMNAKYQGMMRARGLRTANARISSANMIMEFYDYAKRGYVPEKGKGPKDKEGFTEYVDRLDLESRIPKIILDHRDEEVYHDQRGGYMYSVRESDSRLVTILEDMAEKGWDIRINKSTMSTNAVKMLKSRGLLHRGSTKKEIKRLKKEQRKADKLINKRRDNDATLTKVLIKNRFDAGAEHDGSLLSRIQDYFPN